MSAALKPCPFCGGRTLKYESGRGEHYGISCHDDNGCKTCPMTDTFSTDAEAIAAWNTRAPDPVKAELLAALEELDRLWSEDGTTPEAENWLPETRELWTQARAAIARAKGEAA